MQNNMRTFVQLTELSFWAAAQLCTCVCVCVCIYIYIYIVIYIYIHIYSIISLFCLWSSESAIARSILKCVLEICSDKFNSVSHTTDTLAYNPGINVNKNIYLTYLIYFRGVHNCPPRSRILTYITILSFLECAKNNLNDRLTLQQTD